MKKKFLILFMILSAQTFFAGGLDSLLNKLRSAKTNDTNKVWLLFEISHEYLNRGDLALAKKNLEVAYKICDSLKFKRGLGRIFHGRSVLLSQMGDYTGAIESELKSLKICEEMQNVGGEASSYLGLGNIYFYKNDFESAIQYFRRCVATGMKAGDEEIVLIANENLAAAFTFKKQNDSAEIYYKRIVEHFEKKGELDELAVVYGNMAVTYIESKDYKKATELTKQALAIHKKKGDKLNIGLSYNNLGAIFVELKDFKKAMLYVDSSMTMAKETGSGDRLLFCYSGYANIFNKTGNYLKATEWYSKYLQLKDSLLSEQGGKAISEMLTKYDADKKEKEIELLTKDKSIKKLQTLEQEANIKRQRYLIFSFVAGFLIMLVLAFFIFKSLKEKRKINSALENKNEKISEQKKQIEEKNNLIADSIEYARDIQNAVLPDDTLMKELLPASFVVYQPKDIVSGDFYWMKKSGGKTYLAVVDCTGHGVPGAFMSVMVLNILENLVNENGDVSPDFLLDKLNQQVKATLKKGEEKNISKYGLDIALCSFSPSKENESVILEYGGAHHPLYHVRGGKLNELKTDVVFIGMTDEKFSNKKIELKKGDMLYLFSDGLADQFGGEKREKYFSFRLKELFAGVSSLDPQKQKILITQTMTDWRGKEEQIDDILVIGVRI